MRVALLPSPGDAFLLNLWLSYYDKIWKSEVDRLIVHLNTSASAEIVDWIKLRVARSGGEVVYRKGQVDHGVAIQEMLDLCDSDDVVMLCEDDAPTRKSHAVDRWFAEVLSGQWDVVGSPRGCTSKWLLDAADDKWGVSATGNGDTGPSLWPCFLFARVSTLLEAAPFSATGWKAGEIVAGVGVPAPEDTNSDTFVAASLRLRGAGKRIHIVNQYHLGSTDEIDSLNKRGAFSGDAPWLHIGSLSSGFNGLLKNADGQALGLTEIEPKRALGWQSEVEYAPMTLQECEEYERRIAWLFLAVNSANPEDLPELQVEYRAAIDRAASFYGLRRDKIHEMMSWFEELLP
jgi:hypothetical protein